MKAWLICLVVAVFMGTSQAEIPFFTTTQVTTTSTGADICYDVGQDVSEITKAFLVITVDSGKIPNTFDITALNADDTCATFAKTPPLKGSVSFVLSLFNSADEKLAISTVIYIATDIGICESAVVPSDDDNMLRLYCTSLPPNIDDPTEILIDDGLVTVIANVFGDNVVYYLGNNNAFSGAVGTLIKNCITIAATINDDSTKTMMECNSASISTVNNNEDALTSFSLHYSDGGLTHKPGVSVMPIPEGNNKGEVVVYWKAEDEPNVIESCKSAIGDTGSCSINNYIESYRDMNVVYFLYDGTKPAIMSSANGFQFTDYNVGAEGITGSTAEIRWNTDIGSLHFLATIVNSDGSTIIDEDADIPYIATDVTCDENLPICVAYFIQLPKADYIVIIQKTPAVDGNPDEMTTVKSKPFTMAGASVDEQMKLTRIKLWWEPEGITGKALVCVETPSMDKSSQEEYQLILVNQQGQQHHIQESSHITGNDICYSGIKLDTRTFNVTDRVTVVAIKRDIVSQTVVNSSQAEVFLITPEIDEVARRSGRLSWSNPGGYTFTLRRPHSSIPLVTNFTCHTCNYYFNTEEHDDRLVVETEDSKVHITAEIPVPYSDHTIDN